MTKGIKIYDILLTEFDSLISPWLETERLILRRYEESDIDAFYEIIHDDRLQSFIPFPNLTKE